MLSSRVKFSGHLVLHSIDHPYLSQFGKREICCFFKKCQVNNMSRFPIQSVSQLTDVRATDWYFNDLQSLVERFGIDVGYEDYTFKGEQAMTRAEAVSFINRALETVQKMIENPRNFNS
jgi:S-layer homology domain